MIDQELINKVDSILEDSLSGGYPPEISCSTLNELLLNYKSLIIDSASLYKQLAKEKANEAIYRDS